MGDPFGGRGTILQGDWIKKETFFSTINSAAPVIRKSAEFPGWPFDGECVLEVREQSYRANG